MDRIDTRLVLSAAFATALGAAPVYAQAPADTVRDLRNVYARGYVLQDRNGDDVTDFVRTRIVLPPRAGEAHLAAAANIAVRLGYETAATDLGLVRFDSEAASYDVPVIIIGADDALLTRAGITAPVDLAPGQGALQFVAPGRVLRAGGVLVSGYDATGLIAASAYIAGRYPSVWSVRDSAATFSHVAERVQRFLAQAGAGDAAVALDRIVVDAAREGVARVSIRATVADSAFAAVSASLAGRITSAARDPGTAADTARSPLPPARLGNLHFPDLHRLDIRLRSPSRDTLVHVLPPRTASARQPAPYNPGASPDFTLSDIYTIRGLFRDTNQDLVPDRTDAYVSLHGTAAAPSVTDFALRIGLETAGVRSPFVRIAGQDDLLQSDGFPLLLGVGHYQTEQLRTSGKLHGLTTGPGVGFMQFVRREVAGRNALVIGAGDDAGLRAILDYASQRMPYLWQYGKGNYELEDVETEVRRFLQAREAPGQAALALHKLDSWLQRLAERSIDSVSVQLHTSQDYDALDAVIDSIVGSHLPAAHRSVHTAATGFGVDRTIFDDQFTIPWEVDTFWDAFRTDALPRLSDTSRGRIEVRVSESPEIRAQLARDIRVELQRRGVAADAFDVIVLSAYKQGYSWLHDVILPQLRELPVARIEIAYHTLRDSREVRWQEIEAETRWLQEIYPIDAVIARELGIPDSVITFHPTIQQQPIYAVRAFDASGRVLLTDTFDPKYVVRPFFDLFPEYEQVRVTTGWVTVEANGDTLLDRRIRTDPETFWDILQTQSYGKLIEYVMDVQDGRPSPMNAPFFDEFRVDLTLSEPDYRIGIDEEVISSAEALHEDIYFETLTLFSLLGQRYGVGSLDYPGRVLPYVRRPVDGRPGRARITLTGKEHGVPELILTYRERGGEPYRQRYALAPMTAVATPVLRGISARAGADGLAQLLFEVTVTDSVDRYEELRARASEAAIDRQFLSAPLLEGMLTMLRAMHQHGVARDALSFDRVDELAFRFVLHDSTASFSRVATLPRSTRPLVTARPRLYADDFRYTGQRLVQWQTPIPPAENDSILARLNTFPVINVYWAGESFLGQNIYAMDVLPPHDARFISQAKLNAFKPTLLLSGRQHANEVSSTSHILRLAELLATDTAYTRLLRAVNVVLHPITNPDGARLAYEMQLENPDFMLHAGYLGALGVDVTAGSNNPDAIYPESQVRPELSEAWLPDIFINMHGYPSHEWVQYFAGYSAWVRSRAGTARDWWLPRGWFIPGYSYTDDPRYPDYKRAQMAVLDSITASIRALPNVMDMNRRMYARYAKYGRQDIENFREYFHNDVLVYLALRGSELGPAGVNSRRITYVSATTEAPDETARGDWLQLVASAGLAHGAALIRYLATGQNRIEREAADYSGVIMRSVARRKPVIPPAARE